MASAFVLASCSPAKLNRAVNALDEEALASLGALKLSWVGDAAATANVCTPYLLVMKNESDAVPNLPFDLVFDLTFEAGTGTNAAYFSDPGCVPGSETSLATMIAGTGITTIYFKAIAATPSILVAVDQLTASVSARLPVTVNPGNVVQEISLAHSTISGSGPVIANGVATSTITVTLMDAAGAGIAGLTPAFTATDSGSSNAYGTCSITGANGVSTCTLSSTQAENKTLQLTTPIIKTGGTVTFKHGPASTLVFATQPPASISGTAFPSQPVIEIRDAFGNLVSSGTDATSTITLSLQTGTGALGGTATMAAVAGVADFSGKGLNINLIGAKTLRASKADTSGSGGTTTVSIDSASFTISHGAASQLVWTTQPPNGAISDPLSPQPVIEVRDAAGNLVSTGADATATITLSLQTGTGAIAGTLSKAAIGGVADFSGLGVNLDTAGSKTLRATKANTSGSGGTVSVTADSASFSVLAGAPVSANSTITGTGSVVANGSATSTITITLRDATNSGVSGVTPTFSATNTGSTNTYGTCSASDTSGISTCTLASTKAEIKTLSITSPVSKSGGTVTFTHGPASQIVYTSQPSNSTAATAFATQPVLEIRDAQGNLVTGGADATATVTLTLQSGTGTLGGTTTKAAVSGVASFSGLGLNINLAGAKTLRATKADTSGSGGTTAKTADSSSFTISHGAASQLVFTTQPPSGAVADPFSPQPVVEIRDAQGNKITTGPDATANVTLSLQSGTGTLSGTSTMAAVGGIADFISKGLQIDQSGAKTLRATKASTTGSGGVGALTADSSSFTLAAGAPVAANSTITGTGPVIANGSATSTVTITLKDASNNGVAGVTPTFAATNTGSTNSYAACSASDASGISTCTFTSTKAEVKTLSIATPVSKSGGAVTFTHGAASQIVYTTQPSNATAATAFGTQPVLEIRDANGNVVSSGVDATATVTMTLQSGTGTLSGTTSMAAVAGVANFASKGLNLNLIGSKTLRATKADTSGSGGTTAKTADSSSFTISHGAASQIAFTTSPSNSTSSTAFATQPVAEIRDAQGNVVSTGVDATATVTMSIASGTGTLGGTTSMAAVAGVANFSSKGLNIDLAGSKTLRASKANTTGSGGTAAVTGDSSSFTISAGSIVASTSTITGTGPVVANGSSTSTITITLKDAAGNGVSGTTPTFTATNTGTTNTYGTCSSSNSSGVSTCTLASTKAEVKTLSIATPVSKSDGTVTFTNGAASSIVYTTQPSSSTVAATAFATQPVLEIRDANGNVVTTGADSTATVTITLQSGTGALSGTTSMAAVAGVANFVSKGMNINLIGSKTLRATKADTSGSGGSTAKTADSSSITITHGPASQMAFTTQPSNGTSSTALATQPIVEIRDAQGNVVSTGTDATATVTMTLQTGSGVLSGTTSKAAVAGIADFAGNGLKIDLVGSKALRATKANTSGSGGTASVTVDSSSFSILAGSASATTSTITGTGPVVANGSSTSTVTITLKDAAGNTVSGVTPTFTATDTGSTNSYGACSSSSAGGVSTCTLASTKAEAKTLAIATPVSKSDGTVTFTHGAASQIVYTTQPSNATASTAFATQPVLEIRDANGNVVSSGVDATATVSLTLQSGSGTLGGTTSMAAVAGVANFASKGLNINLSGSKTLRATKADTSGSGGTTAKTADSSSFTISHGAATQLAVTTQPGNATSATAFSPQPVIEIRDAQGNVVTSGTDATATISLTLQSGTGTLVGTTSMAAVAGIADFASKGLNIDLAGSKTLRATKSDTSGSGGTASVTQDSSSFTISAGSPVAATSTITGTGPIAADGTSTSTVTITLKDAAGNAVNGVTPTFAATDTGTTNVYGTCSATDSSGVSACTLASNRAESKTLAIATPISKSDGAVTFTASQLAFASVPASATAGSNFTSFTVTAQDGSGATVAGYSTGVTLTAHSNSGCSASVTGTLSGTSATPSSGVATFASTQFTKANTIYLKAASGSLEKCSSAITVNPGTATKLAFVQQPSNTTAYVKLSPAPTIEVLDANDNRVTSSSATVTMAYGTNAGSSTVIGTNSVSASAGLATFTSLIANQAGSGYTLVAASSGLASATSSSFNVATGVTPMISGSEIYSCALKGDGTVYCAGANGEGRYGNGASTGSYFHNNAVATTLNANVVATDGMSKASTGEHQCYILFASVYGYIACSGMNANGELGLGHTEQRSFVYITYNSAGNGFLTGATQVGTGGNNAGQSYSCALLNNGEVYCWGYNGTSRLGANSAAAYSALPLKVVNTNGSGSLSGITKIAVTGSHACALSSAGNMYCWGNNANGAVGIGSTISYNYPLPVTGTGGSGVLSGIVDISVGQNYSCAVGSSGAAYCWGLNSTGQVGNNSALGVNPNYPRIVAGTNGSGNLSGIASISAGRTHVCALSTSLDRVYCWGEDTNSKLGFNNGGSARSYPGEITNPTGFSSISAGSQNTCGIKSSQAYCWGDNTYGQSVPGGAATIASQTAVGAASAIEVMAGNYHSCVRYSTGSGNTYCWGTNSSGQIANFDLATGTGVVTGLAPIHHQWGTSGSGTFSGAVQVGVGVSHACALTSAGTVYCWGSSDYGRLGNNDYSLGMVPKLVKNTNGSGFLSGITRITVGANQTCAMEGGGSQLAYCWGFNVYGQVGTNTTVNQRYPFVRLGTDGTTVGTDHLDIASGSHHTCGVKDTDGSVRCWGWNTSGQLGNANTTSMNYAVTTVNVGGSGTLTGLTQVSAGAEHTCGLHSAGTVYCWGSNLYGQLGFNSSTTGVSSPVFVKNPAGTGNLTGIGWIQTSYYSTCALTTNGNNLYCWGQNAYGQVGDNTTTNRLLPKQVVSTTGSGTLSGLLGLSKSSIGHTHCATGIDGQHYCWGLNNYGQLGDNTLTNRLYPVKILGP